MAKWAAQEGLTQHRMAKWQRPKPRASWTTSRVRASLHSDRGGARGGWGHGPQPQCTLEQGQSASGGSCCWLWLPDPSAAGSPPAHVLVLTFPILLHHVVAHDAHVHAADPLVRAHVGRALEPHPPTRPPAVTPAHPRTRTTTRGPRTGTAPTRAAVLPCPQGTSRACRGELELKGRSFTQASYLFEVPDVLPWVGLPDVQLTLLRQIWKPEQQEGQARTSRAREACFEGRIALPGSHWQGTGCTSASDCCAQGAAGAAGRRGRGERNPGKSGSRPTQVPGAEPRAA